MQQINNINTINNFFDKIYILTIARATERHNKLQTALQGLNYELFFGIDKQQSDFEEIKNQHYNEQQAIKNNRYSKSMKDGEIACALGHKLIYEDVLKNNFERVLILEDDVEFNKDGLNTIEAALSELPADWDVLYFDYYKNEVSNFLTGIKKIFYLVQHNLGMLKWSSTTIKNLFATPYSALLKKAGYHDYASAYAISKKAAEVLVTMQTPVTRPSDHALPIAITTNLLRGFISVPKVFVQTSQFNKITVGSLVEE